MKIVEIKPSDLDKEIADLNDEQYAFVRFHSPMCGHCTGMHKAWSELSDIAPPSVVIMDINASLGGIEEINHKCAETMKKEGGVPRMYLVKGNDVIDEFNGDRTSEEMLSFLHDKMKGGIMKGGIMKGGKKSRKNKRKNHKNKKTYKIKINKKKINKKKSRKQKNKKSCGCKTKKFFFF